MVVNIGELQYISRMIPDLMSLADASASLGVSSERVRQLVISGHLPGVRFGNAWVVPRAAIASRRHSPAMRGRPLNQLRAWEQIAAGCIDLRQAARFQRRAELDRCEMSLADVESLPSRLGALLGGVRAAIGYGELLVDDGSADLYMSRSARRDVSFAVAYVADPLGKVSLRIIEDDAWMAAERSAVDGLIAAGAVALDLLESGDPRHWVSAEHLAVQSGV